MNYIFSLLSMNNSKDESNTSVVTPQYEGFNLNVTPRLNSHLVRYGRVNNVVNARGEMRGKPPVKGNHAGREKGNNICG